MFGFGKKKEAKLDTVEARLAKIREIGSPHNADKRKKHKKDGEDTTGTSQFYELINFLSDESPECRIEAVKLLGKSKSDIAFTHISHYLSLEKDENVKKAMREAIANIREGAKIE